MADFNWSTLALAISKYETTIVVVMLVLIGAMVWWISPRVRTVSRERSPELAILLFVMIFVATYYSSYIFYTVPAGHVGVLWKRFGGGTVLDQVYGEGLHVFFPWDEFTVYDVRVQQVSHKIDVLSADGLKMSIDLAYHFEPAPEQIALVHEYIGPDYGEKVIGGVVGAVSRDILAQNTPQEIFSARREIIENRIKDAVQESLDRDYHPKGTSLHFAKIWRVLIRSITLPPGVEEAIVRKNEQLQLNDEYDYRLLREAKEAERKRIEAVGIKNFQDTITPGITDSYLRWRGIEATLELSRSQNSKIVVIGSGKDGLPVILGNVDSNNAPAVTPKPPDTGTVPPAEPTPQTGEAPAAGGAAPAATRHSPMSSPSLASPPPSGPPPGSGPANAGSQRQ